MSYIPADFLSSDEDNDGLSDDNDYVEFKQTLRRKKFVQQENEHISEADKLKQRLKSIYNSITYGRYENLVEELNKGFEIDTDLENGWTAFLLSAAVASEQIVLEILNRGANIHQRKEDSNALSIACNRPSNDEIGSQETLAVVKILLEKGVDPNAIDRKRRIPLMLAAYNGHTEVVKILLPLCNKYAEDNQRWTALFWAVDGNRIDVVKLLLNNGYDIDKIDIRENTVVDIAHQHGLEEILKLFPDRTDENNLCMLLMNNNLNFEETFEHLNEGEKPQLFTDVCKILYGSKSESIIPVFMDKKICFSDFLSSTDAELKNLGIQLPYQRNRILTGLYRFHEHAFHPKSIHFVPKQGIYTNIDVASSLLTTIKQIIAMEASVTFMLKNYNHKLTSTEAKKTEEITRRLKAQLRRLKIISHALVGTAAKWDLSIKPADRITKKRWNIPWSNVALTVLALSVAVTYYKFKFF